MSTGGGLSSGDKFPSGVVFKHAPWTSADINVPGLPENYDASKEWAGKRVCLISVPGAFTPTCSASHLPPFIKKLSELRDKGIDIIAVIASNDPFVMSAWGKANGMSDKEMLFMSDTESKFAEKIGWMAAPGADRNARFVMLIDKNGTVKYAAREKSPKAVTVSGVDAVLEQLAKTSLL